MDEYRERRCGNDDTCRKRQSLRRRMLPRCLSMLKFAPRFIRKAVWGVYFKLDRRKLMRYRQYSMQCFPAFWTSIQVPRCQLRRRTGFAAYGAFRRYLLDKPAYWIHVLSTSF